MIYEVINFYQNKETGHIPKIFLDCDGLDTVYNIAEIKFKKYAEDLKEDTGIEYGEDFWTELEAIELMGN